METPAGVLLRSTDAFTRSPQLELFTTCTDLLGSDTFTKSDPVCALFVKKLGQWTEIARTESLPNNTNPKFAESFILDVNAMQNAVLRFSVYDLVNFTTKDLRTHDLIGSVDIDFGSLVNLEVPLVKSLRRPGDAKVRGWIHIYSEGVKASKAKLEVQLAATKLEKQGLFVKCCPYFEICRELTTGEFHPVYRSEIVAGTTEPRWTSFEVKIQRLCNGDLAKRIKMTCWNFHNNSPDEIIGEVYLTLDQLLGRTASNKGYRVIDIVRTKGKKSRVTGQLKFVSCRLDSHYTLMDFLQGGCRVNFVTVIDFTLSNGETHLPFSLHNKDPSKNEYERVLKTIGSYLAHYDKSKNLRAYGFGAKLNNDKRTLNCFHLNPTPPQECLKGIEDVVDTYRQVIKVAKLSGPTMLCPVLKEIIKNCLNQEVSQDNQYYIVVLIILDGIINDIEETTEEIIKAGQLPISFVIAGVGPADFSVLERLCHRPLKSKSGLRLHRSNMLVVRLRDIKTDARVQNTEIMTKAAESLAEISGQIIAYMKTQNIVPSPCRGVSQTFEAPRETGSEGTQYRNSWKDPVKMMSRCPTCGSPLSNEIL